MLRKYEIDADGYPTMSIVPDCVVKIVPHLAPKEEAEMFTNVRRNHFTYWLMFHTLTHEISYTQGKGSSIAEDIAAGKYDYSLVFVLVGTTYRLISKAGSGLQKEGGVFVIDVGGTIHDDQVVSALKKFMKENPSFIRAYNSEQSDNK